MIFLAKWIFSKSKTNTTKIKKNDFLVKKNRFLFKKIQNKRANNINYIVTKNLNKPNLSIRKAELTILTINEYLIYIKKLW